MITGKLVKYDYHASAMQRSLHDPLCLICFWKIKMSIQKEQHAFVEMSFIQCYLQLLISSKVLWLSDHRSQIQSPRCTTTHQDIVASVSHTVTKPKMPFIVSQK